MGQCFVVKEIADGKKVAALLTLLGEKTYDLLRNLSAPFKPAEKSLWNFANCYELLWGHFSPKPLMIAERFCLHKRSQITGG